MRAQEFLTELKIDNKHGLGAVPHNADVHYFGLQVVMRPSMFLKLSLPLDKNSPDEQATIQHLRKQINDQGFGAPFLTISVPEAWENDDFSLEAKVRDHDGRHRMYAILDEQGDRPVFRDHRPFNRSIRIQARPAAYHTEAGSGRGSCEGNRTIRCAIKRR